eukprot:gene25736-11396_t
MSGRQLVVFDFDHPIVDDNTDYAIRKAAPGGSIPSSLADSYVPGQWMEHMNSIFEYMHQQGVSVGDMEDLMKRIPLTEGMQELLLWLHSMRCRFDVAILSDSNTIFIQTILDALKLDHIFGEGLVMTNHAHVSEDPTDAGRLHVRGYHTSDNPHQCPKCNPNMCKQQALRDFVTQQQLGGMDYKRILYVGDGNNDLCPAKMLSGNDVVMPRVGYPLDKILHGADKDQLQIKAQVVSWKSGSEIQEWMLNSMPH